MSAQVSVPSSEITNLCDAIARLFQPNIEVVLHDLSCERVAYLAGGFSKREIGEPSLLHEIDFKDNATIIGPYEKINWDGKKIRSISVTISDSVSRQRYLLCINYDISRFEAVGQALNALIAPLQQHEPKPDALFNHDWHEKINEFVNHWAKLKATTVNDLDRAQKRKLVLALGKEGAFKGKNTVVYVARILGLSRASVYNYLKSQKDD